MLHGVDPGALGREFSQLGFSFISVSCPETLSAFFIDPILNMVPIPSEALHTVLVLSNLDHIYHGSFLSFSGLVPVMRAGVRLPGTGISSASFPKRELLQASMDFRIL
jgi:hypothetical protein